MKYCNKEIGDAWRCPRRSCRGCSRRRYGARKYLHTARRIQKSSYGHVWQAPRRLEGPTRRWSRTHAAREEDIRLAWICRQSESKTENEKNNSDARRLSSSQCVDYPGWKDADEWGCAQYSQFFICGGAQPWQYGAISSYTDSSGHSAEDACCACGGGTGGTGGTPVEKHPDFVAIEDAIRNAPSNGVETIVSFSVSGSSIPWAAQIVIPKGKKIVLNNINTKKVGLDAGGTTRHFFVEKGASLSAINVAFKNGKRDYGGAIYSKGTIARLDNVVFEETLRR